LHAGKIRIHTSNDNNTFVVCGIKKRGLIEVFKEIT
jgi:hypothetical protein